MHTGLMQVISAQTFPTNSPRLPKLKPETRKRGNFFRKFLLAPSSCFSVLKRAVPEDPSLKNPIQAPPQTMNTAIATAHPTPRTFDHRKQDNGSKTATKMEVLSTHRHTTPPSPTRSSKTTSVPPSPACLHTTPPSSPSPRTTAPAARR